MKSDEQTFSSFLHNLKRHARSALVAAVVVLLGMTYFVFSMPAVYQASASLQIVQADVQPETLGGTGAREYVEQRLQRARQRVLTADNIDKFIATHKLYQDDDQPVTPEQARARFNESIVVAPQVTGVIDPRSMRAGDLTYGFNVGFNDSDPAVARDVANEVADLFIKLSAVQTKDDAERAIGFLRDQADQLEADLRDREARLADFRRAHGGGLPENLESNRLRAMNLERDLARVDDDLRAATGRKELLEVQLRDTPPMRPVLDVTGQPVVRGEDRLAAAQQELVAALAKYSEDHPDVRRLRREIASLSSGLPSGAASMPNNPTYLQLQTQLNSADTAVRDLASRRYDLTQQLSELQSAIYDSPMYQKQYADLVRDYELVKTQYEGMRQRQATAEVTERAAGTDAAESYVLINPAALPESPAEPDRISLMFLAVVLSVAAALGVVALRNATDSTIRGSADVTALFGSAPLGHVPDMMTAVELRRKRSRDIALVVGACAAAAVVLVAVR